MSSIVQAKRRFVAAVTIAGSLLLAGCDRSSGGTARVGVIGDTPGLVDTVERPLTPGQAMVRSAMAQGLVSIDAQGQIVPGLAERWNVSDDGLSYIFRLQTGTWPNGRRIRADDVAAILNRQLRSASRNPLKDTLGAVGETVAMTERVIEMRLIAPRPNLLQLLAQPEFALVRGGVGSGPFTPATPEDVREIDAEPVAGALYLRHKIRIPDQKDPVERVRLSGGTADALVRQFVAGDLDLVTGGTFADLRVARRAKLERRALRFDPVAGLFGLVPTGRSDELREADVRRLLSLSIDRPALLAGFDVDGLQPRATILQSGLDGIGPVNQPPWLAQPMSDKRGPLAAEADRLFGDTERPVLRIALPEGPGADFLLARLGIDWSLLGIRVERAPSPASADLVLIDEVAPSSTPAWFLRRFRCDVQPLCVEEAEPLLASARTTLDARQRALDLFEAARLMDDAQLFIPLAAPIRWSLVKPSMTGFAENSFGRHTLVGLSNPRFSEGNQ
jgi:oligopeptide transport system substrate-binding protein